MENKNYPIVSQDEITSLNLADLDVQELENRLELALFTVFTSPDSSALAEEKCFIMGRKFCIGYSSSN